MIPTDLSPGQVSIDTTLQVIASLPSLKATFGDAGHRTSADVFRADVSGTARASLIKALLSKLQVNTACPLLLLCYWKGLIRKTFQLYCICW